MLIELTLIGGTAYWLKRKNNISFPSLTRQKAQKSVKSRKISRFGQTIA